MPEERRQNYHLRKYVLMPFKILRMAVVDTVRQDGIEHAGYLAFLGILSLFPFLIFLISIIGFFGASEAGATFIDLILSSAPQEIVGTLAPRIHEITSGPPQRFLTIAIIGVIWTASSSVEGCRTILNRAYRVASPPSYVWRRFVAILEFFVITFSMIGGIIVFIILPNFLKKMPLGIGIGFESINFDAFYFRHIAIFFIFCCTVSLLYYALPNAKQKITQTVPGSILTVTLWLALERLFALYLSHFHQFNFVYGSLAGIIISLMFFYLVSIIFILGAEFNYHFHRIYQVFLKEKEE